MKDQEKDEMKSKMKDSSYSKKSGRRGKAKSKSGYGAAVDSVMKSYNDPSWWFQDPAMARDAASIWFTQRVGVPYQNPCNGNLALSINTPVGGICRVNFIPTFGVTGKITSDGYSAYDTSAINTAAINNFWDIVHANSRNISYEPSDLMRLFICMDNIYVQIIAAARVYGILNTYSTINPYLGKALVTACGWDYDDIIQHIAEFRYQLNNIINQVNRIHIPKVFNIFTAHCNLVNRIFTDGNLERAQLYVMVPNGYYKYFDNTGEIQWYSDYVGGTETLRNFGFLNEIRSMVNDVLNSEYMGVMDGDILKRYGEDMMFKCPSIELDHKTDLVWDEEFMLMLANANFVGIPEHDEVTGMDLNKAYISMKQAQPNTAQIEIIIKTYSDSTNRVQGEWADVKGYSSDGAPVILNLPDDVEARPETVMLSTRMRFEHSDFYPDPDLPRYVSDINSVGTILGEYCQMYAFMVSNTPSSLTNFRTIFIYDDTGAIWNGHIPLYLFMSMYNQYSILPRPHVISNMTDRNKTAVDCGRVDNFAYVSHKDIAKLNYVAITSIFTEVNATQYGFPGGKTN